MAIVMLGEYSTTEPTALTATGQYGRLRIGSDRSLVVNHGAITKTLAASAARTVTAGTNLTAVTIPLGAIRATILLDITASATDATDVLDAYIDVSPDGGTTYANAVHFTQQAGNGAAKKMIAVLDPANPGTAVFDVTSDCASGVVRPALWGTHMRLRYVVVDADANASHTFSSVVRFS